MARKTYAALLLLSTLLGAQTPDARALFVSALRAHGARPDRTPPQSVLVLGSVVRRTPEGDENTLRVAQWYRRRGRTEVLHTRIEVVGVGAVTGRPAVTVRGFDGRHHYLLVGKKKIVVDGRADYRRDLEEIQADRDRFRLILEAFLLGRLAAPGTVFLYAGRRTQGGLTAHKIFRRGPYLRDAYFYVDARPAGPPYFLGVEFPGAAREPKRNLCFWRFRRYGPYVIPQDVRVYENDAPRPALSLWITKVILDPPRPPGWVP